MNDENRFRRFSPEEREIMRCLLEAHANAVAQIAIAIDVRVFQYLWRVEQLENEVKMAATEVALTGLGSMEADRL